MTILFRRINKFYLYSLFLFINIISLLLKMASRHDLCFEQKLNLIKNKERGLSHRDKFHVSLGAVCNVLKRYNPSLLTCYWARISPNSVLFMITSNHCPHELV